MPKPTKITDVLISAAWRRFLPGVYHLMVEYVAGDVERIAVVEREGSDWNWTVFAIWSGDHRPFDNGSSKTKKTSCKHAESCIIRALTLTEKEILEHDQNARRYPGRYGTPLISTMPKYIEQISDIRFGGK